MIRIRESSFGLAALFVVVFAVTLALGALVVERISGGNSWGRASQGELFPQAMVVSRGDSFIEVPPSEHLNPQAGKDFILVQWFQLRRLPAPGNRITLLSKFAPHEAGAPGFAVSIGGEHDGPRVFVYWKDSEGAGKWFSFREVAIVPRVWCMLVLTLQQDRFLGAYTALALPGTKPVVKLAGGYDLGRAVIPATNAALRVGAYKEGLFRGRIGPFGVIAGSKVSEQLPMLLKELVRHPGKPPTTVAEKTLRLWVGGGLNDSSPRRHQVLRQGIDPAGSAVGEGD